MADHSSSGVRESPLARPSWALANVHANEDAADVEDDGANPRTWASIRFSSDVGMGACGAEELRARRILTKTGSKERKITDENDVMDALADIGNGAAEEVTAEDHGADPQDAAKDVVDKVAEDKASEPHQPPGGRRFG